MLRALAPQLLLKLIDHLVSRAEAALTAKLKGESIMPVFEDQRHRCSSFGFVFLMTGLLRDAWRAQRNRWLG